MATSCPLPGRTVTETVYTEALRLTDQTVTELGLGLYLAKVTCSSDTPHPLVGVLPISTDIGYVYPSASCENGTRSFEGV